MELKKMLFPRHKRKEKTKKKILYEAYKQKKAAELPIIKKSFVIALCTLGINADTSYAASIIYRYSIKNNWKVCILSDSKYEEEVNCFPFSQIDIAKQEYQLVLLDIGIYISREEIRIANIKIMVAIMDEPYLKRLNSFLENRTEDPERWKYLFLYVPEKKTKEVLQLMEDYLCQCLPDNCDNKKKMDQVFRFLTSSKMGVT